jgi:hypothetical protein
MSLADTSSCEGANSADPCNANNPWTLNQLAYKRLVDDLLAVDVRQFTSLLCFNLFSHRLKVSSHSIDAN